jgi:hypothetical protein
MVDANGTDIPIMGGGTRTGLTCDRRIGQQKFMATYTVDNCAESEPSDQSSKGKANKGSKGRANKSSKSQITVTATTEDGELIASRTLKCNK